MNGSPDLCSWRFKCWLRFIFTLNRPFYYLVVWLHFAPRQQQSHRLDENELCLDSGAFFQLLGRHAHPFASAGWQCQAGESSAASGQSFPATSEFRFSFLLLLAFIRFVVLDWVVRDFRHRVHHCLVLVQGLQFAAHNHAVSFSQSAIGFVPVAGLGCFNYFKLYAVLVSSVVLECILVSQSQVATNVTGVVLVSALGKISWQQEGSFSQHLPIVMVVAFESLAAPFLHQWRTVFAAVLWFLFNYPGPWHHASSAGGVALTPGAPFTHDAIDDPTVRFKILAAIAEPQTSVITVTGLII